MTLATEPPIRVFLIAENRLFRDALTRLFSKKDDIALVGTAALWPETLHEVATSAPDVLLLDSIRIVISRSDFVRELRQLRLGLKVVLIGMDADEGKFIQAVRAGVAGYVLNDASPDDVVSAVRYAAKDKAVCSPRLCFSLFEYVHKQHIPLPSIRFKISLGLSRREQQLVPLIARGLTNKEIATELQLSEQTVKNHIHRMLSKLGAKDRLTIIEFCRNQGALV